MLFSTLVDGIVIALIRVEVDTEVGAFATIEAVPPLTLPGSDTMNRFDSMSEQFVRTPVTSLAHSAIVAVPSAITMGFSILHLAMIPPLVL